jgi:hypothetical protein
MKIAFLGWGSLLWDHRAEFEEHHGPWQLDGPILKLEFSRVSRTRNGALTLVLDSRNGEPCQVAYAFSKRRDPDDAICDLMWREGTTLGNIGVWSANNSREQSRSDEVLRSVRFWALQKHIDAVIWSDLSSNFESESKCRQPFTIENALCHIQTLDTEGKAKTVEYVSRAPDFIETPLRDALRSQPWFPDPD